ncbi:MAG: glycine cleavage system protein GcvH [Actinomycetota bacterium]|nr:glycine cleavage system protein GcvH [Actinomycetota bacterium]
MTELPSDRRYTDQHEWARQDERRVTVGITDFAQDQLGDIVFVGLPAVGTEVQAGQPFGEVESTKSVSDIYSPVTGTVVENNTELDSNPEVINSDPYGQGWLVVIEPAQEGPGEEGALEGLMSAEDYGRSIEEK